MEFGENERGDETNLDQGQSRLRPTENCLRPVEPRSSLMNRLLDGLQRFEVDVKVSRLFVQLFVGGKKWVVFALLHLLESLVPAVALGDQRSDAVDGAQVNVRFVGALDELLQGFQRWPRSRAKRLVK